MIEPHALNEVPLTSGNCVVYIMSQEQQLENNPTLLAAQQLALSHQLPLAVVFCWDTTAGDKTKEQSIDLLEVLKKVEYGLHAKNVPLMLLFGSAIDSLAAFAHHTKPLAFFFDNDPKSRDKELVQTFTVPCYAVATKARVEHVKPKVFIKHPYTWPGRVQTIAELATYFAM